jgi:hypothetical protein
MNVVSLKKLNISFSIQQMELQATWQVAYMLSCLQPVQGFWTKPPKKGDKLGGLTFWF